MTDGNGPTRRLFCFGFGYTAEALAARLLAEGWQVAGTCQTADKLAALETRGIEAHLFSRDHPLEDAEAAFAGTTHLLDSIPPDPSGDPVLDQHPIEIASLAGLEWAGYLSTTGIYGDRGGDWVDESDEPSPSGVRGRRRVEAEASWTSIWQMMGAPVHIFRLAGIYGPGRNALESVRAGRAKRIDKAGQVFSRIHVDDLVAVLCASMANPNPGAAYNVCDDTPAPPAEVIEYACGLLGVEPPSLVALEKAGLSAMARSFYEDNKRVRNGRIKTELGVELRFPDYRAGLDALLREEGASP